MRSKLSRQWKRPEKNRLEVVLHCSRKTNCTSSPASAVRVSVSISFPFLGLVSGEHTVAGENSRILQGKMRGRGLFQDAIAKTAR